MTQAILCKCLLNNTLDVVLVANRLNIHRQNYLKRARVMLKNRKLMIKNGNSAMACRI